MKLINNYPKYSITEDGKVFSLTHNRYLKPYTDSKGYKTVSLFNNGVGKNHRVHRLVAAAYIDNPQNKPFVNHIDSDPGNNNSTNLEWCTAQENTDHMIARGRNIPPPLRKVQTHCRKGHMFSVDNTIVLTSGIRRCRICSVKYQADYWKNKQQISKGASNE